MGPAIGAALTHGPTHVVDAASWGRDDDPETTLLGHFTVLKAISARTTSGALRFCAVADHVYGVGDDIARPTHRAASQRCSPGWRTRTLTSTSSSSTSIRPTIRAGPQCGWLSS